MDNNSTNNQPFTDHVLESKRIMNGFMYTVYPMCEKQKIADPNGLFCNATRALKQYKLCVKEGVPLITILGKIVIHLEAGSKPLSQLVRISKK